MQPLINEHLLSNHFPIIMKQFLCVGNAFLSILTVLKHVTLEFSHGEFEDGELIGELLGLSFLLREETGEQSLHLFLRGIVKLNMYVSSTRSQESRVQLLFVVSCHEKDLTFLGTDTIESVQET
jgi:hypothetical protein